MAQEDEDGSERGAVDLGAANAAGGVVAWVVDLNTGRISWSDTLSSVLALDPAACRFQADVAKLVHEDDLNLVFGVVEEGVRTERPFRVSMRLATGLGQRWVEVAGRAGRHGEDMATGTIIDVTDRVTNESSALEAASEAQAVLDLLGIVVWEWDRDARVVSTSVHGAAPWTERLSDGIMDEEQFLELFVRDDRCALIDVTRARGGAPLRVVGLRLVAELGGQRLVTRWKLPEVGRPDHPLLGVGEADAGGSGAG